MCRAARRARRPAPRGSRAHPALDGHRDRGGPMTVRPPGPNPFFDRPILNSPYLRPSRHWELDEQGQPTQQILESRRPVRLITPIPKPKKRKKQASQDEIIYDEGEGLSTK